MLNPTGNQRQRSPLGEAMQRRQFSGLQSRVEEGGVFGPSRAEGRCLVQHLYGVKSSQTAAFHTQMLRPLMLCHAHSRQHLTVQALQKGHNFVQGSTNSLVSGAGSRGYCVVPLMHEVLQPNSYWLSRYQVTRKVAALKREHKGRNTCQLPGNPLYPRPQPGVCKVITHVCGTVWDRT